MLIIYILYLVLFVIIGVVGIICMKIKMAGINITDFIRFIAVVNDLDNLYIFSKNNKNMTEKEEMAFIKTAEKMFEAFEKVPSMMWEDEYDKYNEVLEKYKDLRVLRWADANV